MNDSNRLSYYLKNASTHATIIVAVVFGLFSILNLIRSIGNSTSILYLISNSFLSLVYIGLLLFGCYNILRWKFFRTKALEHMKDSTPGWKDHDWKNEQWTNFTERLFDKAIFPFFIIGFLTWLIVVLTLYFR